MAASPLLLRPPRPRSFRLPLVCTQTAEAISGDFIIPYWMDVLYLVCIGSPVKSGNTVLIIDGAPELTIFASAIK